jgi:leucyl aminopeptidase
MNFTAKLHTGPLTGAAYPALVVPAFDEGALHRDLVELDKLWKGAIARALKNDVLTKKDEVFVLSNTVAKGIDRIAFVGMGSEENYDMESLRRAAGIAANALRKRDVRRICFLVEPFVPNGVDPAVAGTVLVEGARLGSYVFDRFKTEKDKQPIEVVELHYPKGTNVKDIVGRLDKVLALTSSTILARDWANTPSNQATPSILARLAADIAKEASLKCTILERKDCEKLGMGAFLGVAQGSEQPPKFIILDYKPRRATRTICLVGKAITFDSGGLSIKTALDMEEMKVDMGGGIAVIATMRALGVLKPDGVRVVGIVPACENMPSGSAIKPGDIVRTQSGKSIEVINTDAEGRLILADGIEFAIREFHPDAVVDIATLTGGCVVALGHEIAGFWTDDESMAESVEKASQASGERVWRMPFVRDYNEKLKSDFADQKNSGGKWGSPIIGAMFLQKYVGETPWMHIDIAGPALPDTAKPYRPKGASGFGPRLLYGLIENWAESS